jgi:hypothetical protein
MQALLMETPWGRRFSQRFTPATRADAQRRGFNALWQVAIVVLVAVVVLWLGQHA